ncbi:hypothetical protein HPB48_010209 [Haemaphysalis longicornis]|uniref:HTH CENPB-type domain-containing protein n=1 Tax=Haemaphysalis longicornis TaxID=44386 RepID=A0A9J6GL73_HAELO|nr:hypothetical protein HPB48_010209 [Haemaphysalis longicornis]
MGQSRHSNAQRCSDSGLQKLREGFFSQVVHGRHSRNIPVSGQMLQPRAKDFTFLLGVENFTASGGWLQSSKGHYDIIVKAVSGGRKHVKVESMRKWLKDEWPQILANYDTGYIFTGPSQANTSQADLRHPRQQLPGQQTREGAHHIAAGHQYGWLDESAPLRYSEA